MAKHTEQKRLDALCSLEKELRRQGYSYIVGVDEAGRGPLAGPVVAAACYIPDGIWFFGVNDSKQLTPDRRAELYEQIVSHTEVHFGVGVATVEQIDKINIYQATLWAMRQAVLSLKITPHYLLVDGTALPETTFPSSAVVQGDASSYSIAAASIIAKEYRDRLMVELDKEWPHYGFGKHKGYGTPEHLKALKSHGPSPHHRKSFEPVKTLTLKRKQAEFDLPAF